MSNKKVLSKATRGLNKTKRFAAPKNIIEDPRGQWAHPGEITRIPSDNITMQGVPYPVMAYPNMGEPQMMYPGGEYNFPGADYVDEYPQMKKGGLPKSLVKMPKLGKKGVDSKKFSRSLDATNKLFTEHYLFAKPKSKKRKVFDPNAQYQDGGATTPEEWQEEIRTIEQQIGSPDQWTLEGYTLLQNKLNEYKNWRENTPEGQAVRDSHNVEGEYNIPLPQHLQDYTTGMMKGRLAYANEFGNPAAKRMVVAPDQPYQFEDGDTGTHFMASMDNYAVPQIQNFNGQLMLGDFGPDSNEAIRFNTPADAQYFAEHYKEITPDESYRREYQRGGAASPRDLDPVHMKKYLADLKMQENANKKGYKNGMWYPHRSVEGGADTIAYGHKLTPNDAHLRKGITEEQATALQEQDVLKNQAQAKRQVDKKYGAGTFDSLPQDSQMLLVDYQYNLGSLSGFPSFVDATVKGNKDKMLAEHTRYGAGKPLTKRNNWTVDVINNMGTEETFDPMQVTIPQANIPDATNVVQPIIFPGPDESIELELTPEEIKQYQMGGYIVEDVEGTDEAAMPCAPGYIFDPRIGKCVPENAYRLSRASVKDNINVDDAIKENRRYYEGYQFMKDWQNSPMYNKMLKEGARSPESYEYMKKMRQQQLDSTPPLQILPQPEDQKSTAGQSWSNTGQIEIFPAGFGTRGTASHELSHSSDRPTKGKWRRLIPQRDVDYIEKNKAKTIADSRAYHNYKDEYDPMFKEYPEYKEDVDNQFKSFYSNYVGEPTEVRARLNEIRQIAKEAGLYDPFTEGVTPDLYYKKLKNFKYEEGDKSGFDGMKQLQDAFSDEEIIWMLNNISKNQDNKEELNTAQDGGSVYTYAGRPGSYYQKRGGKWYISNSGTNGEYVPLQDADGKRTALLNKSAVKIMSSPTSSKEEKYKNLPSYSNSPMVASVKGRTEAERKQVDDDIYTQNLIAKMRADIAESQKNALPQHEQPLVAQDWIWTLPMMGGSAMKSAGTAIADGMGAIGTKVMPYVTGALETSLPFMKAIPGATVGNALGAGFAADAVVNRLPKVPGQISRGEYMDAAENVITGGLDVLGAGVVSPIYEGARGAMSGLKKFVGTEEGLLSNAYKYNPLAFKPNPNAYYRGIGEAGIDDALNTGVLRPNRTGTGLTNNTTYDAVFFDKGRTRLADALGNGNIAEVRDIPMKEFSPDHMGVAAFDESTGKFLSEVPLGDNTRLLKRDWLRGYKEVPVELPGSVNNSANADRGVLESIIEGVVGPRTKKEMDALIALEKQSLKESKLGQDYAKGAFENFIEEKTSDNVSIMILETGWS